MADYRDEVEALTARIEDLERELAEVRAPLTQGSLRCPHCKREMATGTVSGVDHVGSRIESFYVDLFFHPKGGGETKTVDRGRAHDADGFCEDCSTIVVKGRFAD